jgi:hypothetical protein
MGDRANFVVIRDGKPTLYHDNWCGRDVDLVLFWGPRDARDFIETRGPSDEWLNETWADGAAVYDEDHRVLTWFGGDGVGLGLVGRRAYLDLMRTQWPGWEVRWAHEGMTDIARLAGHPVEAILDPRRDPYPFALKSGGDALLTLTVGGRAAWRRISGWVDGLEEGPAVVPRLLELHRDIAPLVTGRMPALGLHVDVDRHTLHYWHDDSAAAIEARVAAAWPGWETVYLRDDVESQLRLSGLGLLLPWPSERDVHTALLARLEGATTVPAVSFIGDADARQRFLSRLAVSWGLVEV